MDSLNETSLKIIQPKDITIELMEHQKTIIYAMLELEKDGVIKANNVDQYNSVKDFNIETSIAILADKVGSGKTLMAITLINLCKTPPTKDTYWGGSKYISIRTQNVLECLDTNLLIVPHKIVPQWLEFFKYAPKLKVGTYTCNDDEKNIRHVQDIKKYDIILLSCTRAKTFFGWFYDVRWSRILIDEADSIKLPLITKLSASFIWLITATPGRMRYSKKPYLSKIFRNIIPWVFKYLIIKNSSGYIEKSIILPRPKRFKIFCLTPRELHVVKDLIPRNILSMINAGNINEAIKLLNCNVDTDDNILQIVTGNIKDAIHNKKIEIRLEKKKKFKKNSKNKQEQRIKIKRIRRQIERLEIRYNSIKEKIYSLNDQYCPICMDEFEKPTLVDCCKNIFCFECITNSIAKNNRCPFCRRNIYKKSLHIINNKSVKNKSTYHKKKDKIDILLDIINAKPNGKFLVFANFAMTFDKIKNTLQKYNITYKILKGRAKIITKTIKDFKNGKINVLMLNAKYFGAGMNLQMATDIVIYHRFNRELEEQVIGRAQRLGRKTTLNVFYLLHDNENSCFNDDNDDKFEEMDYYEWLEQERTVDSDEEMFIKNMNPKDINKILTKKI